MSPPAPLCPICASESKPFCTKHAAGKDWHIAKCRNCGHGFVVNRPTLADLTVANESESTNHALGGMNVSDYSAHQDAQLFASLVRATVPAPPISPRVLDVGCGNGAFSYPFWKIGYVPLLTDLDSRAAGATAVMTGATFQRVTFEDLTDPGGFDAIIMSQVLEHALDPMAWLTKAANILTKHGRLLVALPNFGGIYRLLGAKDPYLIPPVHVNFFTPKSMRLAMAAAGLKVFTMRSVSGLSPYRGDGSTSPARYLFAGTMNILRLGLDHTTQGICLVTVAGK